jgi:hypothetical protein
MRRFFLLSVVFLSVARVFALPVNLAPAAAVTGSSAAYGSVVKDATDGNRDGGFYSGGSVWHTAIPDAAPYVQVDLGATYYLDRVKIWPRTDVVQNTVETMRIKVLDAANAVVWEQIFLPNVAANNPWGTTALRGVQGRKVRLERADVPVTPNFLTLAEFEVWGQVNPIPANLCPGKPYTANGPGANGTLPNAGHDGVIDGDFAHPGRPIYQSNGAAVGLHYEVDLSNGVAADQIVDYLRIFNRTDLTNTSEVLATLRNDAGVVVFSQVVNIARETLVLGGRQYDVTVDFPGTVAARYARIETTLPTALTFAELEVFGPEVDVTRPQVVGTSPMPTELVAELTTAEVFFDEDVIGVSAGDLLVNGVATVVEPTVEARRALFTFPQPPSGVVTFALSGITDVVGNPLAIYSWTATLDTTLPPPQPFVSEVLADNRGGLKDEDGETPDWIEITNPGPTAVNLGNWYLSDVPGFLTKWQFPSPVNLPAGQSVVVFASSKNRRVPGAPLHTNFKLDPDGESVLLVRPDGMTIASQILGYPPQSENVSFGLGRRIMAAPIVSTGTPGRFSVNSAPGWAGRTFNDQEWTALTAGIGFDESNGLNGNGPMGLWTFDDNSAADASGRGNTGTVVNATFTPAGHTGGAMAFAGNGVVRIPAAATGAFDGITARNAFTVAAWFYGGPTMPVSNYAFFAGSDASGGGERSFGVHLPWTDSAIYWDTAGCCDGGRHRIMGGEPNPARYRGQWNHYAFVKNGDQKEIWQNGMLFHSGVNTEPMINFRSLFIGAGSAAGGTGYVGSIDDFGIWEGALQPSQIVALASGADPLGLRSLTPLVASNVSAAMRNVSASAFLRLPFTVVDPASQNLLVMRMRYDDGFVAYLNGTEIWRRNAGPVTARPSGAALVAEEIDISRYAALLVPGTNVLAIHGMNVSAADADFLVLPELRQGTSVPNQLFQKPTPGALNDAGVSGFAADTVFAPQRGFYGAPVNVSVTCATPGAVIVTTTDGSVPTLSNGAQAPSPAVVAVTTTTTLRAAAFVPDTDVRSANVDTHTYLFADHVVSQTRPSGAPLTWPTGQPGDYTMDPRVEASALPGYRVKDALLSIPTLSVTAEPTDLWGIYASSGSRGDGWERAASAEWLDPAGGDGFTIRCGLSIHGNISRDKNFTPKHSFKLLFRSDYGDTKLEHALFPGSAVQKFDQLVLRAGSTDTFPCIEWAPVALGPPGATYQRWARRWASYIRDQWVRDTQIAMGHASANGRFCHLYLNGSYWGLYNVSERPDEDFMASHLGSSAANYDVLADFAELKSGEANAWSQLMAIANAPMTDAIYQRVQGRNPDGTANAAFPVLLDVENLIDYMILHVYHGADDWPNHNWWAGRASRDTTGLNQGFRFFSWDQEISNVNLIYERTSWQSPPAKRTDVNAASSPAILYASLKTNSPAFRRHFGDRVHRHLFNTGVLTNAASLARWNARLNEIDQAIVAESARWGDYQPNLGSPGQPYRREVEWLAHRTWMEANYWNNAQAVQLAAFRSAGLYPAIEAPSLNQFGGEYAPGFGAQLTHTNASGTIYYTLDGTDPGATASVYAGAIPLSGIVSLKARVLVGTAWSALTEATFRPDLDLDDDALPDAWEALYGLSSLNPADALLDSDGDGASNRDEYASGTLPLDGRNTFTASAVTNATGLHLQFQAIPGRVYRLEGSDELATWQTVRTMAPVAAAGSAEFLLNPAAAHRFYRVVVVIEP